MIALFVAGALFALSLHGPACRILLTVRPRDGPPSGAGGLRGIRARITRGRRPLLDDRELARDIDVYAAAVASGAPAATATQVVAWVAGPHTRGVWQEIAGLYALGTQPERAWEPAADIPVLAELGAVEVTSGRAGSEVAREARRIADEARSSAHTAESAAAQRAGVLIALPLTVCFLPAFFILGLAPVVIALAGDMF